MGQFIGFSLPCLWFPWGHSGEVSTSEPRRTEKGGVAIAGPQRALKRRAFGRLVHLSLAAPGNVGGRLMAVSEPRSYDLISPGNSLSTHSTPRQRIGCVPLSEQGGL
jgi:hypothetical protein